ncbi:MAG: hypothetical protein IJW62_01710 [Clostridia bacterium]|nr:hypothetical protein [Clostridia bacterium]
MKKQNEVLQDAIGMIDDDLLLDAKQVTESKPRTSIKHSLIKWGSLAACLAVAITAALAFLPHDSNDTTNLTSSDASQKNPLKDLPYYTPAIAENLWKLDNFDAYSIIFENTPETVYTSSQADNNINFLSVQTPFDTMQSQSLSISNYQSIKVESLLGKRYIAYYSEDGIPVFYDTVEKCEVNLEERIIGESKFDIEPLIARAIEILEEQYPGSTESENNRILLRELILSRAYNTPFKPSVRADIEFMKSLPGYQPGKNERSLRERFKYTYCVQAYADASIEMYNSFHLVPFRIRLLGLDPVNGLGIVQVVDLPGNGLSYLCYNVVTDTITLLPKDISNTLHGTMLFDGAIFRFSRTGNIVTVAYPKCGSDMQYRDLLQRTLYYSSSRKITYYDGEYIGYFNLVQDIAYRLDADVALYTPSIRGASEAFVSSNESVVYYKLFDDTLSDRTFQTNDQLWYNRLQLHNLDTDQWVFCTMDGALVNRIIVPGNFVRFIADETAVIMERNGQYYAYSLADGEDITQEVAAYSIPMMAHERLLAYTEAGYLYTKELFSDSEQKRIAKADSVIFSDDGAFAFIHNDEETFVTCINIVSLDSCRIEIDSTLCTQFFNTPNAVFQMIYNKEENTLTISFYQDESVA